MLMLSISVNISGKLVNFTRGKNGNKNISHCRPASGDEIYRVSGHSE